jgi:hypothetical protein
LGEDKIYFELAQKGLTGMTEFNTYTGGKNSFGKPDFNTDYSLKKGSDGIDTGDNAVVGDLGDVDLVGNKRVVNVVDVGAFEFQEVEKDTDFDGIVTANDGNRQKSFNMTFVSNVENGIRDFLKYVGDRT